MEKLLYNVSQILGTTIIHSLWQGLLIYTALQLVFLAVLGLSAQKKHNPGGKQLPVKRQYLAIIIQYHYSSQTCAPRYAGSL